MPDPTAEFFDRLGRVGRDPVLGQVRGRVRFDLAQGDEELHWTVTIDSGNIDVSRDAGEADCVVRTTKERFDDAAGGKANATAMLLRSDVTVEGDIEMFQLLERTLPGPSGARDPRTVARDR